MPDFSAQQPHFDAEVGTSSHVGRHRAIGFAAFKKSLDITVSVLLLPIMLSVASILVVINPLFNKGPLFYRQERMGLHCASFTAIKFRTMLCAKKIERSHADPVETHRITPLGQLLRRTRVDELPQILNVLSGDMSLIGPRPDYLPHAQEFLKNVPGYRARHAVRPGISGLAQTEIGYAIGAEQTRRKVVADLHYIRRAGYGLELWIFWRTICIVFGRHGS